MDDFKIFTMFKKIFFSALILFFSLAIFSRAAAAGSATVYFFWGDGCPHCAKEEVFIDELKSKYPQVQVRDFEVWKNAENQKLLAELGQDLGIEIKGVPFTIVGEKYFSGWYDKETTGKAIEDAVVYALNNDCRDLAGEALFAPGEGQNNGTCGPVTGQKAAPEKVNVPFLGEIEIGNYSLPVLTIILGGLDGFNPCAMWTLLFLISLLLGMEDRRRMWVLGSAFIVASAFVYFLFLTAWLNLLLFLGFIFWVRVVIGGVALFGGGLNLKEYFSKKPAVCKASADPKQQKVFARLKAAAQQRNFYLALGGIILLAFMVNLVELVCSAGLPAIFSQILAMSGLNPWQQFGYILLYIFFFMLDDMVVFFTAMVTLRMAGVTTKYQRASHLIGGVLMLLIGVLLIFKPEWLMF